MNFEIEKSGIGSKRYLCVFLAVLIAFSCLSPCAGAVAGITDVQNTDVQYGQTYANATDGNAYDVYKYLCFELNADGESYYVSGVTSANMVDVVIPFSYEGLPVTGIGECAFEDCKYIRTVYYEGTREQWDALTIEENGNSYLINAQLHYNVDVVNYKNHWGTPVVTLAPTCTENGSQVFTCPCGYEITESVKASHKFSEDWLVSEPTCDMYGYEYKQCADCGYRYSESYVNFLVDSSLYPESEHDYANSLIKPYRFKYDGAKSLTVTFSKETFVEFNKDYIHLFDENGNDCGKFTGSALAGVTLTFEGSAFSISISSDLQGTGYGFSFDSIVATINGDESKPPLGHDLDTEWTIDKQALCAIDGSKSHHCLRCGSKEDVTVIPAKGHSYVNGICTVCNADADFVYFIEDGFASIAGYRGDNKEVVLPTTCSGLPVTRIASLAFENCTSITSVTIPDNITSIGANAFKNCSGLTSIVIPDSVAVMDESAFADCTNLLTVVIGKGITSLPKSVFKGCEKLTTVVIPSTVTKMDSYAFMSCSEIANVYYEGTKEQWEAIENGLLNSHLTRSTIHPNVDLEKWELHWGDPVEVQKPTCTQSGFKKYICPCDFEKIETLDALGHILPSTVQTRQPTCTKSGCRYKKCTVCGAEIVVNKVEKILVDSSTYPESEHDYQNNTSKTYAFGYSGADRLILTFSAMTYTEEDKDFIYIYDENEKLYGKYSGSSLSGTTITLNGSSFKIKVTADDANRGYGFSFDSIVAVVEEPDILAPVPHKLGSWEIDSETRVKYRVCTVCNTKVNSQKIPLDIPVLSKVENAVGYVKVSWNKVVYADGYYVYRKVGTIGSWKNIATVKGGSTLTYKDTDVSSGKTYSYMLKAYDGKDITDHSEKALKVLYVSAPKLTKIENTSSGVKVTWEKVSGAVSYNVYRKVKGGSWVYLGNVKTTSYTDKKAKTGTTYYYTVRAKSASSYSLFETKGIGIKYVAAPKLTKTENVGSTVKVTWTKVAGADGYYVYRNAQGVSGWKKVATIKGNTKTTYSDKNVSSGKAYTYKLQAYSGTKASCDSASFKIVYLTTSKITKLENSEESVKITWSKVAGADGYYLYRKGPGEKTWKRIATVDGVTYNDTNVSSGSVYTYTVKPFSGSSTTAPASSLKLRYLSTPVLSTATSTVSGVKIGWGKVTGADGYYVYRKTRFGNFQRIATVKSKTSFLDSSAKKGTTYYYTVIAYKGTMLSSYDKDGIKVKDKY